MLQIKIFRNKKHNDFEKDYNQAVKELKNKLPGTKYRLEIIQIKHLKQDLNYISYKITPDYYEEEEE